MSLSAVLVSFLFFSLFIPVAAVICTTVINMPRLPWLRVFSTGIIQTPFFV